MKATIASGFIEQVIKEINSTIIIYQPPCQQMDAYELVYVG